MRPIQDIDKGTLSGIKFICTDIDDTLTRDGKLKPEAYQALWSLHDADLKVIPVTGRPAGWCDLIARQWPVDAVVGENGAFAFYLEDSFLNHMYFPAIASQESGRRLDELLDVIRKEIPECRVSKDQFSRKFDLAIDFCEEPPDLGFETAQRIAALCELHGATAKISSIHVNAWFGSYTKVDMLSHYLSERWDISPADQKISVFYCGDSPNDEPMFEQFPLSCAVANITPMLHLIKVKPTYITEGANGAGFAELANIILSDR